MCQIQTRTVITLLACTMFLRGMPHALAFEAATLTTNQSNKASWHDMTFESRFDSPPIVMMGPVSFNGGDPSTLRIRNVVEEGFQFQIDEWDYRDGSHTEESLSYLAVEAGVLDLDGIPAIAGRIESVGFSLQSFTFDTPFQSPPVILFQIEASDTSPALVVRPRRITAAGFQLRIQAEEKNRTRLTPRPVHFIALEQGQYLQSNGQPIIVGTTGEQVTHSWFNIEFPTPLSDPVFLAHMQSTFGGNTASLRHRRLDERGVQVKVEEEQSLDTEVSHIKENVGFIVIGAVADHDEDGLPDNWEIVHGLDPTNPSDAETDQDGDGTTNLEEFAAGTDPHEYDGTIDGGIVRLVTENESAYEKELLHASFLLRRAKSDAPIEIKLVIESHPDSSKSNAAPSDYRLIDSNGAPLANPIALGVGQRSIQILVAPIRDSLIEVPETLRLRIAPSDHYEVSEEDSVEITIFDATNTPANERLFVATLRKEGDIETNGSGLSTIRLQGDNQLGIVNLAFDGLTSIQTAVHLHIANPVSGPPVESLELGQVIDHWWTVRATQFLTSDQEALDALINGRIYVNVHSANFPAGEIRGDYRQQEGAVEFELPDSPSPLADLNPEDLDRDISRFLMQSTFGPTPELMSSVRRTINQAGDRGTGLKNWLDVQMNPTSRPAISLLALTKAADQHEASFYSEGKPRLRSHNLRHGWWVMAAKGSDHLRQRVAFALSQIFIISTKDSLINNRHYGAAHFYDMLSQGAFGSYRELLEGVTKHPIMGHYLSHLRNQKDVLDEDGNVLVSPDENFAREIMQLFSIGLVERHPDGTIQLDRQGLPISTYDQNDITELARVMTGMSFSKRNIPRNSNIVRENTRFNYGNGSRVFQDQWIHPMRFFEGFHDQAEKTLVGGHQTKASQGGEKDLDEALDALANHPNTAPFISRLLIQRLVTSNPSRAFVYRASKVFTETKGNLGEVVATILLDPEARSLEMAQRVDAGKQKEPIIRYLALCRALDVKSQLPLSNLTQFGYPRTELNKFPSGTSQYRMGNTDTRLSQTPQGAPTVFNWFLPDFTVAGPLAAAGLVAPEFQVTTESQVIRSANAHYTLVFNRNGQGGVRLPEQESATDDNMIPDFTAYSDLLEVAEANNATKAEEAALLVDYTDLLLNGGNLKAVSHGKIGRTSRQIMVEAVADTSTRNKAATAIYLFITSPEYITQK
jgi:uncharacterized protein (DUF1800 family)